MRWTMTWRKLRWNVINEVNIVIREKLRLSDHVMMCYKPIIEQLGQTFTMKHCFLLSLSTVQEISWNKPVVETPTTYFTNQKEKNLPIPHNSILTLMKFDDMNFVSVFVKETCCKNYTYKDGIFFRKEVKFLSVRHNLKFNCIKMPVSETYFKIFSSSFLHIQHFVMRNKFTSFRPWKLETLILVIVKEIYIRIYYEQ